jgi:hypothetical protein
MSGSIGGRPRQRRGYVQRRATSRRCQRSRVSRRDEEVRPAPPRQHTRDRGQEDPIGVGEIRTRDLPTEDRQLMAQHDDLEILGSSRTEPQRHQFEHSPGHDVQQRWQHAVGASR